MTEGRRGKEDGEDGRMGMTISRKDGDDKKMEKMEGRGWQEDVVDRRTEITRGRGGQKDGDYKRTWWTERRRLQEDGEDGRTEITREWGWWKDGDDEIWLMCGAWYKFRCINWSRETKGN